MTIKNLENYLKVKNYLIENRITDRKFFNIRYTARQLNLPYPTVRLYGYDIIDGWNKLK